MIATTSTYSIKPSAYTRAVMGRWLGRYMLLLVLPVIATAIAAAWRIEMLVVAFMLLLLVYPFALFNVYFRYALTVRAAMNVTPHRVVLSPEGNLFVEYIPDEEHTHAFPPLSIGGSSIVSIGESRGNLVVVYGRDCGDLLLISPAAFEIGAADQANPDRNGEPERLLTRDEFLTRIYENIRGNCVNLQS